MLLPSALSLSSCDDPSRQTRYSSMFSSAPLSPSPSPSSTTLPTLYSTCRALQSMLTSPNQLPSPPTTHAEIPFLQAHSSPFKLRLRARKADTTTPTTVDTCTEVPSTPRRRITKRACAIPPPPPRGVNKRRRSEDDGYETPAPEEPRQFGLEAPPFLMSEADQENISSDQNSIPRYSLDENENEVEQEGPTSQSLPSTPKRLRRAPEILPLGLDRSDFCSLRLPRPSYSSSSDPTREEIEDDDPELDLDVWSTEDDRALVELVLEKLKLTKSEWQDCARSLGRDRKSVGRRWRSLMGMGEVGLKGLGVKGAPVGGNGRNRGRVGRRTGIHGSWR